ncbi:amino acid ABC transporter substrate-binding protein [Acidovorax sp. SUPP2825]|uniref:amino acid ABC transporter substrate-binding protein n=1 Tax=Acidovorax sp. SUPP2825 TaxID=2920879 RepID=UPI0023DE1D9F|nr:amino acid ABC transporter substrate-binding protein [Acidovorax sp. SUPP2825]GKS92903.1 amino acid ABC transporter substrate-binding protein [Acidovorax sp. SUPP2825]
MFRSIARLLPLLACAIAPFSAMAQGPANTLQRIQETHSITLGVREAAWPFSFLDDKKAPAGYSVDLCLAAVDEIKRTLKLKELDVKYKVVSGTERIPKLEAGEIDLECGSTTNTKARQDRVAFSNTVFVAGIRVLVPKGVKMDVLQDLAGLPVAVSKGTTSEKLLTQLAVNEVKMQLKVFASDTEAYKAFQDGTVRAYANDDSLLLGMAAKNKAADKVELSKFVLSVEPYAIMMRKGDTELGAVVDRTLNRLFSSRDIDPLYKKWFATEQFNLPMARLSRESFSRPNKEPGVAMILGYSI